VAAGVVALALVLAHTVTGAAGVVFAVGTALRLLATRETRRRGSFMAAGSLVLGFVFWRVNALPYGGQHGSLSLPALASLRDDLRPWLWPMVGLALAVASSWRRPAHALPALGTVGLGVLYYLYGSTLLDQNEHWFVLFNAQRFLHLGLLLGLLPAVRGDRRFGLAAVLLVAVSAAWHPTVMARVSTKLVGEPLRVVDASEIALFERIRKELPVDARILFPATDHALSAFTGRSQSPTQRNNIWGLGTLPASEFEQRVGAVLAFPYLPWTAWPSVLDRWRYSHALVEIKVPPEVDPASARHWLEGQLPAGELIVQMASGNRFLLARRTEHPVPPPRE